MFNQVIKVLNKKSILVITSVIFVLFMAVVLPWINYLNGIYIGVSMSPDTSLFYSPSAFYQMLYDYGQEGRNFYILIRWTFDLIYPFVYGLFLVVAFIHVKKENLKYYMILLPILGVIFDFLENISATILIAIYPSQSNLLVYILQIMSFLKWLFLGISIVLLLIYTIKKVYCYYKK